MATSARRDDVDAKTVARVTADSGPYPAGALNASRPTRSA